MSSFDDFLGRLSSAAPVPGGGSVAALEAAMAASLLAMVAGLTLRRKKFAAVHEQVAVIEDEAVTLRDRAIALAHEDEEAYAAVASAMALPRESEGEKAARRDAIASALQDAAGPPLITMRMAARILEVAGQLVDIGNPSAVSDVGTAALAARAAFHAARLNVEINVAGVKDDEWAARLRHECDRLPDVDRLEQRVLERVAAKMAGA